MLEHEKFTFLLRQQCPRAELEIVALRHPWEYIERVRRAVPQTGLVHLDDDTVLSAGSFEACLRAAGGAILAVDEVMSGKAKNAFVAIRPAGHHAEATTASHSMISLTFCPMRRGSSTCMFGNPSRKIMR